MQTTVQPASFGRWIRAAVAAALVAPAPAGAQGPRADLGTISLEDLMQVEVTSASKKEQKLSDVPSAIFVISQDDIRRSGSTTLAEVLRLVPGLEIARIDANKWAVASRGFNGRFADKMLVLIDGRSVYTPLFSGVYWDVQDLVLADIERIEVIRGPGATLWGANAVNGVINIISKAAADTVGGLVSLRTGGVDRTIAEMRYGAAAGGNGHVRTSLKYTDRSSFPDGAGRGADRSESWRGSARGDWRLTPDDKVVLEGQIYSGTSGHSYGPGSLLPFFSSRTDGTTDVAGGDVLARWTRSISVNSEFAVQAYYDRTTRDDFLLGERRDTADVEFQGRNRVNARHELVWGAGYRVSADRIRNGPVVSFAPERRVDSLLNAFVQDEVIVSSRLRVSAGTKVEHNDYSAWEVQPDARALFVLSARQRVWGALSRAVRTPSRAESDVTITSLPSIDRTTGLPAVYALRGTEGFLSEVLHARELGYRLQAGSRGSIDVAAFANRYSHLRTFEPGAPRLEVTAAGPMLHVPIMFGNEMSGRTSGVELATSWEAHRRWRVDGAYTYLKVTLVPGPNSRDTIGQIIEDNSPRHQVRLASHLSPAKGVECSAGVSWIDRLPNQGIGAYTRVDARIAWDLGARLTFAAGGDNLFGDRHQEFGSTLGELPTQIPQSGYANLTWRF